MVKRIKKAKNLPSITKLINTSWYLKISVKQLNVILAVTRGYHRFASSRLGYEQGDAQRIILMKKAAVSGDLRITHEQSKNGHNNFYFYFDKDYLDSTGNSVRGEYCISQWDSALPYFESFEGDSRAMRLAIEKGVESFGTKTQFEWLKKFLNLE